MWVDLEDPILGRISIADRCAFTQLLFAHGISIFRLPYALLSHLFCCVFRSIPFSQGEEEENEEDEEDEEEQGEEHR